MKDGLRPDDTTSNAREDIHLHAEADGETNYCCVYDAIVAEFGRNCFILYQHIDKELTCWRGGDVAKSRSSTLVHPNAIDAPILMRLQQTTNSLYEWQAIEKNMCGHDFMLV